ncbi:hypothetical protein MBLNU13_g05583t1 [Cladosporium sp. NU13]
MSLFEGSTLDTYDHDGNDEASILFDESLSKANEYPTNLVYSHRYDYQLEECKDQLDRNEKDMFGLENWVDLFEAYEGQTQEVPGQRWPWALRPTVTYHSFDAESGKSVWMVVKANELIKNRIRASCDDQDLYQYSSDGDFDNSFESTLRTHLVLCALAGENWRWYINYIEQQIQDLTRGALVGQMTAAQFSFADLQRVHFVEEKANEALMVLEANAAVIQELCEFYTTAETAFNTMSQYTRSIVSAIAMFRRHLDTTAKDLAMQQARSRMLMKLLADRKSLLASTLQWRSSQTDSHLAHRAQLSAENMEVMTEAMHTIAHETKMEAANMRIITLVTLFFLPGTFVSTLMSTPIVHFPDEQRIVNLDALKLFLAISLPLLAVTIVTWYALYYWHKARRAEPERELEQCQTRLASPQFLDCQEVHKA